MFRSKSSDDGRPSPALESAIADAISLAERILSRTLSILLGSVYRRDLRSGFIHHIERVLHQHAKIDIEPQQRLEYRRAGRVNFNVVDPRVFARTAVMVPSVSIFLSAPGAEVDASGRIGVNVNSLIFVVPAADEAW